MGDIDLSENPSKVRSLPEGWTVHSIKEIAYLNRANLNIQMNCPVIHYIDIDSVEEGMIKNIKDIELKSAPSRARRIVHDKDILISSVRPNLRHYCKIRSPRACTVASTGFVVLTAKGIDPDFLYYSITTREFTNYLSAVAETSTTAYPSVTADVMANYSISCPRENEQKAIAKILSDLDSKIELNQKMNKTLEAIAQTIFKHWFIDFEFPNEDGKPYKSNGGEMVDSELGEIPKGWQVRSIGEVSNVIRGVSYRSAQLIPSENALVTLKSILRGGGFTKNGYKPYSGDYKTTQLLNSQDVIIAFTDLTQQGEVIGRAAIVEDTVEYKNMIASMDIGVIRFNENFPFKFFIYQLLKSESFHSHILGYVNGTTVLHLSNEGPKTYKFSCPDRRNLIQFENLLSIFYSKIQYNTKEIELLTVIRYLLLPKLMSGKIRVPLEE